MTDSIAQLIERLRRVEDELEAAFAAKGDGHGVRIEAGKPRFDEDTLRRQRRHRKTLAIARTPWPTLLTMPLIYAMALPLFILDLSVSLYQLGCFTAWKITWVRRNDYVVIDRHRLGYLNPIQKLNCLFCGYGNGVIAYAREITARTEQYWCPIKHALRIKDAHPHYASFQAYGDAEGFVRSSAAYRARLRALDPTAEAEGPPGV